MKERGFTLLEFIIAFAIITVVIITVYITQGNNLASSVRINNLVIARNLAANLLAESETKLAGEKFAVLKEEEEGKFPEPYERFSWKREIKEIDFTAMLDLMAANFGGEQGITAQDKMMLDIVGQFLKKSMRKLIVTVEWEDGKKKANLDFVFFLVDNDAKI